MQTIVPSNLHTFSPAAYSCVKKHTGHPRGHHCKGCSMPALSSPSFEARGQSPPCSHPGSTLASSHNHMDTFHSCGHHPLEESLQQPSIPLSILAKLIALCSSVRCFVVSFVAFWHNSTTSRSYWEPNIYRIFRNIRTTKC